MKYLPLIWAGLWRKPVRSVLTLLSIVIAFLLFGVLHGVNASFDGALAKMSETRLRVMNRANMLEPLPIAYGSRIEQIEGIRTVSHASIMVAYYQDPKNGFPAGAVDPDTFFTVFPEIKVPAEQRDALRRTRTGAVAGIVLAKRYGWKIGDHISVHSMNLVKSDGSSDWEFDIVGFCNAGPDDSKIFANELYFNYDYLDTARATGAGTVHQFAVTIDDAKASTSIALAIDRMFANSTNETSTLNDRDYVVAQIRQVGDVQTFINAIIGAVLFTLLFLAGNTMMQSVRDRIPELGVLKTLGFSDTAVWLMVVGEALVLCTTAALIGLGVAAAIFQRVFGSLGFGIATMPLGVLATGVALAALLALIAASVPASRARRLTIVEATSGR